MTQIRTNNLFVTSQVYRWLQWLADAEASSETESTIARVTPDALCEKILRDHIIGLHPNISEIEAKYWSDRRKLDDMVVKELKGSSKPL